MKKIILGSMLLAMTSTTLADTIKLSVGLTLPPYFIKKENRGLELDIIREALKVKGHNVEVLYMPSSRSMTATADGVADATATINEASGVKCHYSDVHVTYQNVAVSLKSKNVKLNSISDLKSYSVVSFQNSTKYLGSEYAAMAKANSKYAEKAKQQKQNMMLYTNKIDVAVGDINIFKYFNKNVAGKVDITQPIMIHELFPKTPYKVCFKNAQHKNDFNEGLKKLKSSGKLTEIQNKYTK